MSKSIFHILAILSVSVMLASCGSSRKSVASAPYIPSQHKEAQTEQTPTSLSPLQDAVVAEARKWLGTPYKYGGNDARGIDCSGLVLQVYQRALSIDLPRNSRAQHDFCSPTAETGLVPGDLLFFATGKDHSRVSHVGIYVGGNNMIHASASKGVIVSDFTAPYYQRTFAGARYVGQYHAMLEPEPKRQPKPKQRPATKSEPRTEPKPEPRPEPRPEPTVPSEPLAEKPSSEKPQPPMAMTPNQAMQGDRPDTPSVISPAVATAGPDAEEPSAADARASVLGSLTETPLK